MPRYSILIVDDEAIVRESLKDWLQDSYVVDTTETGEEALELLRKQDFSILIVDVRLPGKSGLEVLKEIKETKPEIKSIVITAFPSMELAHEIKKLGTADYLIKPISPDSLEILIRETLKQAVATST